MTRAGAALSMNATSVAIANVSRARASHLWWGALGTFVASLVVLTGCEAPRAAQAAPAKPPASEARLGSETVTATPCVVSGPEVCFNATDDNCNGLLDEGCGVRMGLIQFMAAWSEADVDVDLEVIDPSGEVAEVGHVSQSGLTLQQDCPGKQRLCYGQNYENVYLDSGAPAPGRYQVTVRLEALADAEPPVLVRLGARIDGTSHAALLRLDRDGDEESVSFVLPPISEKAPLGVASTRRDPSPR